ncbi:ABC transporter ATP-binding protein [Erysipelothrix rhusiopathiae]|nr:ABC transporter ATP-binding protein [Erysipelothrix rhusiopathiae]
MIQFNGVSKKFKDLLLFEDVNIKIREGKKTAIVGPNGSGKSVLLKLIVGYSVPTSGSIVIDGKKLQQDIDFVPNGGVSINAPEFIGSLTGLENLREIARIRRCVKEADIILLAKKVNFEAELSKKYKTYSLGMKQKMRLIQALMERPDYLILDEPFDGLDRLSKKIVIAMLDEYVEETGCTLVFTKHGEEVFEIADVVYEIDDKKLRLIKGESEC